MKYYIINLFNNIKNLRFFFEAYSRLIYSIKYKYIKITRRILYSFTMDKLFSAIITCVIVALCKYFYSGNIVIDWRDFFGNFSFGLFGWTFNTCFKELFSYHLDTKGLNFNLHQLLFGLNSHKMGDETKISEFKPKLYNAMDNPMDNSMDVDEDNSAGKPLNKGKGLEEAHPNDYDNKNIEKTDGPDNESKPLDKGKAIDQNAHPFYQSYQATEASPHIPQATEPPLSIWKKVYPGLDPADVFFPKRVNPGPGFNVPGGVVPIRDEICQHIDYNSHILNQFRKMDLETAIEQRNNNIKLQEALNHKLGFAQNALSKIPETPTTDYDIRLKAQIIKDMQGMHNIKIRSEARATLLLSRIEFIQNEVNKKK